MLHGIDPHTHLRVLGEERRRHAATTQHHVPTDHRRRRRRPVAARPRRGPAAWLVARLIGRLDAYVVAPRSSMLADREPDRRDRRG